jgi:hypothetical protein
MIKIKNTDNLIQEIKYKDGGTKKKIISHIFESSKSLRRDQLQFIIDHKFQNVNYNFSVSAHYVNFGYINVVGKSQFGNDEKVPGILDSPSIEEDDLIDEFILYEVR